MSKFFDPLSDFRGKGQFQMPELMLCNVPLEYVKWAPVNLAGAYKQDRHAMGIHFFCHDRRFEGMWNDKNKLLALADFYCAATPDFSVYTDMPLAFQVWQRFRSQYLGAYMQNCFGMNVIPTLCWSTEDSFEFTFDGIPKGSTVVTNSLGIYQNEHQICSLHRAGLKEAIRRIEPKKIWVYGGAKKFYPDYDYGYIEPFYISMVKRRKEYRKLHPEDKNIHDNNEIILDID